MIMMMMGNQNPNMFTAAQWEELEQQALIFKYIVSGVPVPTHLILSVRRSLYSSSFSLPFNQPTIGACLPYNQLYQIDGYGRKIDLEPGRCRRTDGKKWRCSKEAYPDSKYCERHMHRGRNRSRKPVESFSNVSSSASAPITKSIFHSAPTFSSVHSSLMDSSSCSYLNLKDYRYLQGMKELKEDERSVYFQLNDPNDAATQKMQSDHHHHHHH